MCSHGSFKKFGIRDMLAESCIPNCNELNQSNNTGTLVLNSIYYLAYKLL